MTNECDGVYQPQTMSLERFIRVYVAGPGPGYANGETPESVGLYLAQTIARLNRYFGLDDPDPTWPGTPPDASGDYVSHVLAGSSIPLRLPRGIPFRQQLTTVRPNRSYRPMVQPIVTVQHTTNNPRQGADAGDHAQWQANGTPGHPDGAVAVHFYVDDTEIVQTLPIDEQGIHSGDWRNQQGVAVERTTNAGLNVARANDYAIALQAGLLRILGTTAKESMYPHTDGGHCPQLGVAWNDYEGRVDAALVRMR